MNHVILGILILLFLVSILVAIRAGRRRRSEFNALADAFEMECVDDRESWAFPSQRDYAIRNPVLFEHLTFQSPHLRKRRKEVIVHIAEASIVGGMIQKNGAWVFGDFQWSGLGLPNVYLCMRGAPLSDCATGMDVAFPEDPAFNERFRVVAKTELEARAALPESVRKILCDAPVTVNLSTAKCAFLLYTVCAFDQNGISNLLVTGMDLLEAWKQTKPFFSRKPND